MEGDFHFTWECLSLCLQTLWGKEEEEGSLSHLKNCVNRTMVDKTAKHFQAADEFFRHVNLDLCKTICCIIYFRHFMLISHQLPSATSIFRVYQTLYLLQAARMILWTG